MTAERLKHGYVDTRTGLVFWGYNARLSSGEQWMTAEKFQAAKLKQAAWERRQAPTSARKKRNTGPDAAAKRAAYDQRKRAEDITAFRSKVAAKSRAYRSKNELTNMACRCRGRIASFMRGRGIKKHASTFALLGCDVATLCNHIASRFLPGMSWDNRHKWHVDHVIPLASAHTVDDITRLCHYTNLQPLWATENQRKNARIV